MTDEKLIARLGVMSAKHTIALEQVLLFHSVSPWTDDKREAWLNNCVILLGAGYTQRTSHGLEAANRFDATTKVLCDCVREALKEQ